VLELAAGVAAVERVLDPSLAGLLLGECARAEAGSERAQKGAAVAAAEVVSLTAAAVVEIDSPPCSSAIRLKPVTISAIAVSQSTSS